MADAQEIPVELNVYELSCGVAERTGDGPGAYLGTIKGEHASHWTLF